MSVEVKKIVKFCEDYLKVKDFQDYCVNGLQVEGSPKTSKIITGVTLSEALIKETIKKRAKMIIAHHGIFSKHLQTPPRIKGVARGRLKLLLENNINLCGFHLPLDAHPVIGNNISLCKLLKIKKLAPFYLGFVGELEQEMKLADFVALVNKKLQTNSQVLSGGPKKVKRIGVVSGASSSDFELAKTAGADTYLCGDIRESIVQASEEVKINIINAGHYNTEKLGVKNLGNLIARKFEISFEFVDVPCGV